MSIAKSSEVNGAGRSLKLVLTSSLAGTILEWYEFFIFGTAAALIFNRVFFPETDALVGTLLSLATFSVAFIARPLGAVIFGHFGDKIGRKPLLIIAITVMGGVTFLIGLLPSYDTVGVLAPILLVLLRIIQGISLGGEYGGALLMGVEHAGARRGLAGGVINTGALWGSFLAALVFLPLTTYLTDDQLLSWGWRIPFLSSIVVALIGLLIRLKVDESPEFELLREEKNEQSFPLKTVLRKAPLTVILIALAYMSAGVTFYVVTVFSLAYGSDTLSLERSLLVQVVLVASVVTVLLLPIFGWLSDLGHRKTMFLISALAMGAAAFVWFPMLNTGEFGWMLLGTTLILATYAANYGVMGAFFAYSFPASIRYSGLSLGYNIGTVLGAATAPAIATALLVGSGGWVAVAIYMAAVGVVSCAAAAGLREEGIPQRESAALNNEAAR